MQTLAFSGMFYKCGCVVRRQPVRFIPFRKFYFIGVVANPVTLPHRHFPAVLQYRLIENRLFAGFLALVMLHVRPSVLLQLFQPAKATASRR